MRAAARSYGSDVTSLSHFHQHKQCGHDGGGYFYPLSFTIPMRGNHDQINIHTDHLTPDHNILDESLPRPEHADMGNRSA